MKIDFGYQWTVVNMGHLTIRCNKDFLKQALEKLKLKVTDSRS